jgi:SAM-dependent methyltransferase
VSEALFRLFERLPRQGPGSDACTREALRRLPELPAAPRVLDLGCGAGRQTLVLAETLRTKVVALDIHWPFLDQLQAAARERGLEDLIEIRCADMRAPGVPAGSVDLLWSEGAIYLMGFADGLRLWRPLLASKGYLVASECSWLTDARPAELEVFWRAAYPAMGTIEANVAAARREGFEVLDHFVLPPEAWWGDFYEPLEARMGVLAPTDPELAAVIAETRREIDLYRRFSDAYGYVFYLMRLAGSGSRRGPGLRTTVSPRALAEGSDPIEG